MKQQSKFQQHEHEQAAAHRQETQQQGAREFATVEDMLRADAAETTVPSAISERLNKSAESLPPQPARSRWQRWFGG